MVGISAERLILQDEQFCVILCVRYCARKIMATNLAIDNKLLEEAKKVGRHRTKKGVVTEALQEYIQFHKQQLVLDLFGTIEYAEEYDYKTQRNKQ